MMETIELLTQCPQCESPLLNCDLKQWVCISCGYRIPTKERFCLGVVGSSKNIPKSSIYMILKQFVKPDCLFISGGAFDTDNISIEFAIEHGVSFKIFHPNGQIYTTKKEFYEYVLPHQFDKYTEIEYFTRNGYIAYLSKVLCCFIQEGRYRCGTWNTISQYLDLGKSRVNIFNENGDRWMFSTLPKWTQDKIYDNQKKRNLLNWI